MHHNSHELVNAALIEQTGLLMPVIELMILLCSKVCAHVYMSCCLKTQSLGLRALLFFLQRLHKICLGLYIAFFCKEAIAFQIALSAAGVCIMRLPLSEKRKKSTRKWPNGCINRLEMCLLFHRMRLLHLAIGGCVHLFISELEKAVHVCVFLFLCCWGKEKDRGDRFRGQLCV